MLPDLPRPLPFHFLGRSSFEKVNVESAFGACWPIPIGFLFKSTLKSIEDGPGAFCVNSFSFLDYGIDWQCSWSSLGQFFQVSFRNSWLEIYRKCLWSSLEHPVHVFMKSSNFQKMLMQNFCWSSFEKQLGNEQQRAFDSIKHCEKPPHLN